MSERGKWDGMLAIARFNWPFYAAAGVVLTESVTAVLLPGAGTGDGKRIGVRIRTAAIRTTARTMRRGSMVCIGERSGHRIESAGPERMTAPDSAQGHPSSACRPVTLQRLDGVRRTRRIIAAGAPEDGGQRELVPAHYENEELRDHGRNVGVTARSSARPATLRRGACRSFWRRPPEAP